jgi:peptidoglycan/LPS O-acetylase OafA/YrhL
MSTAMDPLSIGDFAVAPPAASPRALSDAVARQVSAARIQTIDAARLIAVMGIVFIHSIETPQLLQLDYIGTFGVPFYLFASLYFQARSFRKNPNRRLDKYIESRAMRLYVPFLGWSLIYLLARDLKHSVFTNLPPLPIEVWRLWVGTATHLWFLPMLMIVTIFIGVLSRFCSQYPRVRWTIIVISALVGTVLAIVPRPDWLNHVTNAEGAFYYNCWKTLPSVFLGLALAWWMAWQPRELLINPAIGFAGFLMTVMMVGNQIFSGYSRVDRTLSGLGWLIAALADWRGAWVGWLARVGKHAYGIYLSHILFVEGFQAVMHHRGYGASVALDLTTAAFSFLGAVVTTLLIARTPGLRWLNGD